MKYWDDTSSPTGEAMRLIHPGAMPPSSWEYAALLDVLTPKGSAAAAILQLNGDGELCNSDQVVVVFDYMLPDSTHLLSGSHIKIAYHSGFGQWCLDDWTVARG